MSATEYTVDLRDIRFVLHEQLKVVQTLGAFEDYADFDQDMYDQMLDEALKISTQDIGPTNRGADQIGCKLDDQGNVTTPPGYKEIWKTQAEGGWFGLTASPDYGGMGAPYTLDVAVNDIFTGGSVAYAIYPELARGVANLMDAYGEDPHRQIICDKIYAGEWGGTMCLTEPGAGSDVGANRCKASPTDDDEVYLLEGEKIFISGGDHDMAENLIHLVLARLPDADPGTSGLSIFMVPKFEFDEDGNLGERNGIFVESIEEKMGIHGSATSALSLGARKPCKGWLLGDEGEGMRIMFHMMNEARIGVGLQGLTGAAAAYENALGFAKERIQGRRIEDLGDDSAPSVTIIEHPDVRRMLMWQRVHVQAMRSLIYETAFVMDRASKTDDPNLKRELDGHVDLMIPIVKAFCSDKGFESTVLAVQTCGGYGYTQDYPVEQYMRDTKIASIYEGTNGIQAMDLLGRKMTKSNGVLYMTWLNWLNRELDRCKALDELGAEVTAMEKARDALGAVAMDLGGKAMMGKLSEAMLHATRFLELFGTVVLGYQSLWQARIAIEAGSDDPVYKGKVLNAKFYCANILPNAVAISKSILASDTSCLDDSLFT